MSEPEFSRIRPTTPFVRMILRAADRLENLSCGVRAIAPVVTNLRQFRSETNRANVVRAGAGPRAFRGKKSAPVEVNSAFRCVPHPLQFDPDLRVETGLRTANSDAVSRTGMSARTGTGIVVTICLNNTLRHSRQVGQVADDLVRPVFPAPASTPVTGIIGVAEERFGLRKSPTAPMPHVPAQIGGWFSRLALRCCRRTCLGQKRRASQAVKAGL